MNVSDGKMENVSFPHELALNDLSSILFCSVERILEDNSAPGVVRSFSSSIELEDIDSESLVIFFLGGLECVAGLLGTSLAGEEIPSSMRYTGRHGTSHDKGERSADPKQSPV